MRYGWNAAAQAKAEEFSFPSFEKTCAMGGDVRYDIFVLISIH